MKSVDPFDIEVGKLYKYYEFHIFKEPNPNKVVKFIKNSEILFILEKIKTDSFHCLFKVLVGDICGYVYINSSVTVEEVKQ